MLPIDDICITHKLSRNLCYTNLGKQNRNLTYRSLLDEFHGIFVLDVKLNYTFPATSVVFFVSFVFYSPRGSRKKILQWVD